MRMEFGFDVLQIAKGNYATNDYHGFIGFKIDTAVLSRAFLETYGLDINRVFNHKFSFAVETFRWIVANIFPVITRAAWVRKKDDIRKQNASATAKNFHFRMRQKQYNKDFGTGYKRPGFFPTALSLFIRVLPKAGPFRALKFKAPTPLAETYFVQSFDSIIYHYSLNLKQLNTPAIILKDIDFDTGKPTALCEYSLADATYQAWAIKLKEDNFKNISPPVQENILNFFGSLHSQQRSSKVCSSFFNAMDDLKKYAAGN
jgi:hypothetical protein